MWYRLSQVWPGGLDLHRVVVVSEKKLLKVLDGSNNSYVSLILFYVQISISLLWRLYMIAYRIRSSVY